MTPADDGAPWLTISLARLAGLRRLDADGLLARFGAGTVGPDVEAALRARGLTLGHYPQSFEYSTVGGWVATRSSGQQSIGFGRIEALFAGGTVEPTFSPGVRIPGPEAKGAAIGFGDVHGRAHLYRAVVEGLAYALREAKERTERRTKVPITALRVSGGGARSDRVVQITADIFGLPVGRPHTFETSGLGAAIDAAVGLGIHPSFEAAVASMTRLAEVRDPDAAAHARYDALYRRVCLPMYGRLRPLYEEIRAITGYPE